MLPYYLAALRGEKVARINMAYLHGYYPVKPWHRLVFIFDARMLCSISPLCRDARGRGVQAIRGYTASRQEPPRGLKASLSLARRQGAASAISLAAGRRLSITDLSRICLGRKEG